MSAFYALTLWRANRGLVGQWCLVDTHRMAVEGRVAAVTPAGIALNPHVLMKSAPDWAADRVRTSVVTEPRRLFVPWNAVESVRAMDYDEAREMRDWANAHMTDAPAPAVPHQRPGNYV